MADTAEAEATADLAEAEATTHMRQAPWGGPSEPLRRGPQGLRKERRCPWPLVLWERWLLAERSTTEYLSRKISNSIAQKAMYGRKGKIERYFFSRVPAIYELFSWAEKPDGPITEEHLREAVGEGLTTTDRDGNATDHTQALNCAIWGILSNALSGEAAIS